VIPSERDLELVAFLYAKGSAHLCRNDDPPKVVDLPHDASVHSTSKPLQGFADACPESRLVAAGH
jgi:hypothetical protein